jgi:hypothetical protein
MRISLTQYLKPLSLTSTTLSPSDSPQIILNHNRTRTLNRYITHSHTQQILPTKTNNYTSPALTDSPSSRFHPRLLSTIPLFLLLPLTPSHSLPLPFHFFSQFPTHSPVTIIQGDVLASIAFAITVPIFQACLQRKAKVSPNN